MDDDLLASTRVALAGRIVAEPVVRTGGETEVAVLKVRVEGEGERLEWVRAESSLARFVAQGGFKVGDPVLVVGAMGSRVSKDRVGRERTEFYTLAARLAHDESAAWVEARR